ncbi:MAG: hypothetical protein WBG46_00835 [Nonlabens sp.]
MAKLYDQKPLSKQVNPLEPKEATLKKIIAFSNSFSVTKYKNMTFDTINN